MATEEQSITATADVQGDGSGTTDKMSEEAANIALAAVDELAQRAQEMDQLRGELETTKEQLVRKAAEFQNYRRRTEQERGQLIEMGKGMVIQQVLDVLDDLRRSLEATRQAEAQQDDPSAAYDKLKEGVDLVYNKFSDVVSRLGVEPIEAVGKPFNEMEHEAMMQQPGPEGTDSGTVLTEIQKGYRMGDRVLRHAKVIVAA